MQHLVMNNRTVWSKRNRCATYSQSVRVHQTHHLLDTNTVWHWTRWRGSLCVNVNVKRVWRVFLMDQFNILGNMLLSFLIPVLYTSNHNQQAFSLAACKDEGSICSNAWRQSTFYFLGFWEACEHFSQHQAQFKSVSSDLACH